MYMLQCNTSGTSETASTSQTAFQGPIAERFGRFPKSHRVMATVAAREVYGSQFRMRHNHQQTDRKIFLIDDPV